MWGRLSTVKHFVCHFPPHSSPVVKLEDPSGNFPALSRWSVPSVPSDKTLPRSVGRDGGETQPHGYEREARWRVQWLPGIRRSQSASERLLPLHCITCHLADAFIQSDLQLIRLSRRHTPRSNVGLRAFAQGPNSCADLIVATPGIEPPTLRVQVQYLNRYATGCPLGWLGMLEPRRWR